MFTTMPNTDYHNCLTIQPITQNIGSCSKWQITLPPARAIIHWPANFGHVFKAFRTVQNDLHGSGSRFGIFFYEEFI